MNNHDDLIERLCREAGPVKRPASPWLRSAGCVCLALACGFLASLTLHRGVADWSSPGGLWAGLGIALSFCLGALAVAAAFTQSIAGYRMTGGRWIAALFCAWAAAALAGVSVSSDPVGHYGEGSYCFTFMLVAGTPMIVIAVAALRRTRALHPVACLAHAGLGIAAMAQVLLGFCHPVAGDLVDLSMHFAAALTLVAVTVLGGRRWIAI